MKIRSFLAGALSLLFVVSTTSLAQAFTHPGISHSQADLDRMKNNTGVEPYKTAYAAFSSDGHSQPTNESGPSATDANDVSQFTIRNDANVVHNNAVMWYVTGNTVYRDHAIKVMMDWANTMTAFNYGDYLSAATAGHGHRLTSPSSRTG